VPIDLEKIGKLLKEKRESQGITLVDVSNSLCIRKSLIDAIESGNWKLLPHEVYVKGYLKEYAHLLNIYDEITDIFAQKEEIIVQIEVPIQQKIESRNKLIPKRALVYPLAFVLLVGFFILSQMNKEEKSTTQIQYTEGASKNINDNIISDMKNVTEASDAKKLMITCLERTYGCIFP
jgi:cytoskeletal protein RodZ